MSQPHTLSNTKRNLLAELNNSFLILQGYFWHVIDADMAHLKV
jgi:hypothetical protein